MGVMARDPSKRCGWGQGSLCAVGPRLSHSSQPLRKAGGLLPSSKQPRGHVDGLSQPTKTEKLWDQSVTSPEKQPQNICGSCRTLCRWHILKLGGRSPLGRLAVGFWHPLQRSRKPCRRLTGTPCRNFLSRTGMRVVWPCANLSTECKCRGKRS